MIVIFYIKNSIMNHRKKEEINSSRPSIDPIRCRAVWAA